MWITKLGSKASDIWTLTRFSVAAPFSLRYRAKQRWFLERHEWERLGIAQADLARKTYVVPETGAVCITVSKSANTTLKFMLHSSPEIEERHVHTKDHRLTRLTDRGITLGDLARGDQRIFTFVRHPIARFWSGYKDKIFGRSPTSPINAAVAAFFCQEPRSDFPPEMVLEYVRATSPVDLDEHIRPQWSCTGVEKIPLDFVGRVENMADDIRRLHEQGLLTKRHVDRYGHLHVSKSTLPTRDTSRIDALIRDIYARDMEIFAYD